MYRKYRGIPSLRYYWKSSCSRESVHLLSNALIRFRFIYDLVKLVAFKYALSFQTPTDTKWLRGAGRALYVYTSATKTGTKRSLEPSDDDVASRVSVGGGGRGGQRYWHIFVYCRIRRIRYAQRALPGCENRAETRRFRDATFRRITSYKSLLLFRRRVEGEIESRENPPYVVTMRTARAEKKNLRRGRVDTATSRRTRYIRTYVILL